MRFVLYVCLILPELLFNFANILHSIFIPASKQSELLMSWAEDKNIFYFFQLLLISFLFSF